MAAALSTVRGALAGLSPREKQLLLALGVVFFLLVFVGFYFWSSSRLDAIEEERAATVEALTLIQRARPQIAARAQRREALLARYRIRAPSLATFVGEQATATEVQVSEVQDRPATPVGTRFTERSVQIRLRAVSLEKLVAFLDRIDGADFPVAIKAIRIHRRFGERNSYDVDDLVIATWDQASEAERAQRAGTSRDAGVRTSREVER